MASIIHGVICQIRTLDTCPELRPQGMDVLCALATQLGRSYKCFIPIIHRITIRHKISHPRYDILVAKVVQVRDTFLIFILYTFHVRLKDNPFPCQPSI